MAYDAWKSGKAMFSLGSINFYLIYLLSNQQPPLIRIIDCRPKTAAMANRATGHGYESSTNYPTSQLTFQNIGNIHAMRDSHNRLTQLLQSVSAVDVEWLSLVESTKWLTNIRMVLNAAYRTAHAVMRDKTSVLVHCSHGWDRTSQVVALAQIMLDPYYRTFRGFQVLVEKDFLSFGHPFQLRHAYGQDPKSRSEDQISPIFLQVKRKKNIRTIYREREVERFIYLCISRESDLDEVRLRLGDTLSDLKEMDGG